MASENIGPYKGSVANAAAIWTPRKVCEGMTLKVLPTFITL